MWLKTPQPTEKLPLTPLLRARAGHPISGYLTGEPLRCFVHFAAGRSWPCTDHACTLCKRQIAKRCYAYYPVMNEKRQIAIFELTAQAEEQLLHQMNPHSDVPTGHILIRRERGRRNLPCIVEWESKTKPKDTGSGALKQSELKSCLMRIWNLPETNGQKSEREYLADLNEIIKLKTTDTPQR